MIQEIDHGTKSSAFSHETILTNVIQFNRYVGATSGPKDVAIILDISASMGTMRRVDIMKEAVSSVLDTLNSNGKMIIMSIGYD